MLYLFTCNKSSLLFFHGSVAKIMILGNMALLNLHYYLKLCIQKNID